MFYANEGRLIDSGLGSDRVTAALRQDGGQKVRGERKSGPVWIFCKAVVILWGEKKPGEWYERLFHWSQVVCLLTSQTQTLR